MRKESFGQNKKLTLIDKFGVFLSSRRIINFARVYKPEIIVDVGCGYNASTLRALKPFAKKLIGVDMKINPALENIERIETTISDNLAFLNNEYADMIVMNSVLEHLKFPEEILSETYRVLEKGGILIINVPNWIGKYFLEFSAFRLGLSPKEEMDDHKMYYGKRDLWPLVIKAGFRPSKIKLKYYKFFLNTICYVQK